MDAFDLFDILTMIGGLCLFLFGMNVMGEALEKRAGHGLRTMIGRLTSSPIRGFLTGLGVTSVIQSSSATTVMVVGFVNSGVMTLHQSIYIIMGANVGTTVTAWLLSLTGIQGDNIFLELCKPTSFTPVLALIGIIMVMTSKSDKKKDTGTILLGFATLMFGMDAMSSAVSGLKDVPEFQELFLMFTNPILGVLAGAILTAIIQSSSASVGILQALSSTGAVSLGAAIPIIMGQNIGTCVTAMLSSIGTTKNARRAALVHLSFNIVGCALWMIVFYGLNAIIDFAFLDTAADQFSIAICHSVFNVVCTLVLMPCAGLLEKMVMKLIPEDSEGAKATLLDPRLLVTPALAMAESRALAHKMANEAADSIYAALDAMDHYTPALAEQVRQAEDNGDRYEDELGSYLVKLSAQPMSYHDSDEVTKLLHLIGDFERISDHAVNIVESVEETRDKEMVFSDQARQELAVLTAAVRDVVALAINACVSRDLNAAAAVEPLEEVVDRLHDRIRARHIRRLQQGECSLDAGFVLSDLLTNLERVADHCSNIAGCIIEMDHSALGVHGLVTHTRTDSDEFERKLTALQSQYVLPKA